MVRTKESCKITTRALKSFCSLAVINVHGGARCGLAFYCLTSLISVTECPAKAVPLS
jgi:hypothetical protein